ncbi:hypothetical protein Tco_1448803 [Tanacetum coccineum]
MEDDSRVNERLNADDRGIDIRPIYNEEPMAEVQTTAEINIFATGQQHTEQPEFNNEGEVDQNAEQCHDIRPLPAKLTDNMTTELSDQSLESENVCLKNTVAQFQKDFSRMEAHCVNLELKYQNQVLKEGQQGQFLNVKSNEAKVKNDIDVTETINIELEHTDQASVFMAMTFEQRSSTLVLHQMTSDHNRSELRIQDHNNEPSKFKAGSKSCSSSSQDSYITTRVGITIPPSYSNAEDNRLSSSNSTAVDRKMEKTIKTMTMDQSQDRMHDGTSLQHFNEDKGPRTLELIDKAIHESHEEVSSMNHFGE